MNMSKKYFVLVVCCLMAIGILGSCTVAAPSSNNGGSGSGSGGETPSLNPFNLASCYRIYGDNDCRAAATSVAMDEFIGVVAADGATNFSIASGNDNGNFAINSSTGVLTAAKAFAVTPTFSQRLVITVRQSGTSAENRTVTVTNDVTTATMGMAAIGAPRAASAGGGSGDITLDSEKVTMRCGNDNNDEGKCFTSIYTGAWGGWFANVTGAALDLRPYQTVYINYNLASGGTPFEFKMESAGVTRGGYLLNNTAGRPEITADGMWQTVSFPLTNLRGLRNGSGGATGDTSQMDTAAGLDIGAITVPLGFFNQGTGKKLSIDEVYIR